MSEPSWSADFEALLPELLQSAYEHADLHDDLERIWLLGLREGEDVRAGVAYRLRGRVLDAVEVVGAVAEPGDPDALLREQRRHWARLFDLMGSDGEAATQVRVRYDVTEADAATEFDYDPVDSDTLDRWRSALR